MAKKQLTAVELYERNEKRAKFLKFISPICFWGFIALSIVCLCLAIKFSLGNVAEIINLLDDKIYTGEQLQANYDFLIAKYGEWGIGNGGAGFTLRFINIGKALFSHAFILNITMACFFLLAAFILGKWTLPKIANQIVAGNQDMVNKTVLKNSEK